MNKTVKILVAGAGGVGGFFGGLLCRNPELTVFFLSRGEHGEAIRKNGLQVLWGERSFTATPVGVGTDMADFGEADYIFLCVKNYHLETAAAALAPAIGPATVVIPLLNGVNSVERVQKILPQARVVNGGAYIVARIKEPGVVENNGNIQQLFFGTDGEPDAALVRLRDILRQSGIDAELHNRISAVMWEKFIFLSPTATATTYFDCSIGALLESGEKRAVLENLIREVIALARARNISIAHDLFEKTLFKLQALPYAATSSLHNDVKAGKSSTEMEALTGYVVHSAGRLHLPVPVFTRLYKSLRKPA